MGVFELRGTGRKQRYVLNIGIVFGRVGDEMMDVMGRFPPSDTQSTTEVRDEDPNQRVWDEFRCDPTVSSIVRGKHDLLPEHTQE